GEERGGGRTATTKPPNDINQTESQPVIPVRLDADSTPWLGVVGMNPKRAPAARKKRTVIGVILTLLLAGLSASVFGQGRTSLIRTRIGMPNRGVPNLGLVAAQRYGFFRAQALEAELIVMRPSLSLQTLMAGDLDYSTVLASAARASVSGLPLRILMTLTVGQDFSLVVRS